MFWACTVAFILVAICRLGGNIFLRELMVWHGSVFEPFGIVWILCSALYCGLLGPLAIYAIFGFPKRPHRRKIFGVLFYAVLTADCLGLIDQAILTLEKV